MKYASVFGLFLFLVSFVTLGASAQARDQIRITGSSSIFPFATSVAEEFGRTARFKTPIVEGIGTGGGFKLFCSGAGVRTPDIVNASRRIKPSEISLCTKNGVTEIIEIKFGLDGIVLANTKSAPLFTMSLKEIYLALAALVPRQDSPGGEAHLIPNPYENWQQINPAFPDQKISVFGPPPTSGTRDAFIETALEIGCSTFSGNAEMRQTDSAKFRSYCRRIREDGVYIESGENDNLIIQKLQSNDMALGIFAYSFLNQNSDILQASLISSPGRPPTAASYDTISSGEYPIYRSLYFYVKKAHIGIIPGISDYLDEFTSEGSWGDHGYLTDRGLVPLKAQERRFYRRKAMDLISLSQDHSQKQSAP